MIKAKWCATRQGSWQRAFHKWKVLTPVARLQAIRILLAYAYSHDIKLFQMVVKNAFLNGYINELVYVEQPPGFEDPRYPKHVYGCPRHSMVSRKLLELGMRGLGTSSLRRASRLGKLTQHYSPRR